MTNYITPSNISPWEGNYEPGARFSSQQLYGLERRNLDPETVETITVKVKTPRAQTDHEVAWGVPIERAFEMIERACPVVRRTRKGPIILTSGGDEKLWTHR